MTRKPLRRLAALAVPCLLLLSGLTACETQTGVAAFVGSTRITESHLRAVVDEALKQKAIAQKVGTNVAAYRQAILSRLVKHVLIASAAGKLHLSASTGDVDKRVDDLLHPANQPAGTMAQLDAAFVTAVQLPPSELRPFLRDQVLMDKIGQRLTAGAPFTDAQLQKFYDEHGGPASGQTLEQVKPQVIAALTDGVVQVYVTSSTSHLRLKVNPRFGRFERSKIFAPTGAIVSPPDELVRDTAPSPKVTPSPSA